MSSAKKQPKKYFDVVTYIGNGGTQSVDSLQFAPDLVWIKSRTSTQWYALTDTVRGANLSLASNGPNAEEDHDNVITSFDSEGFSIGNSGTVNDNTQEYVAWCWNVGDTNVTNNDGDIQTLVRNSKEAGFSILSYTGSGTGGDTIGHGLGKKPSFAIIKNRGGGSQDWTVYHDSLGVTDGTGWLLLNSTDGRNNNTNSDKWSDVAPDDSVITLGTSATVNRGGDPHIAYCWTEVPGYSSFGSYLANGSADGPMVNCGFKPAIVIMKNVTQGGVYGHWFVHDTTRDPYNISDKTLGWDTNVEENDSAVLGYDYQVTIDFLSNGFKVNSSTQTLNNVSGNTYVYMAFADVPPFAQTTQVLNLTDATNLDVMQEGDTVTTPSGGESEVLSNEGTTLEVSLNEADPFLVGEVASVSGQGSGTIQAIDSINNTLTVSNVSGKFVPNQDKYVISSTARRGAMAVSDPASSVLEAASGYQVEKSAILRNDTGTYLTRTPSVSGNRKTFTISCWVKRGQFVNSRGLMYLNGSGAEFTQFGIDESGYIVYYSDISLWFKSPGTYNTHEWLHIVMAVDTTQAIDSDRVKVYVNGESLPYPTSGVDTLPQNQDMGINRSGEPHLIGNVAGSGYGWDGYITEYHLIDGEAMGPETFGYELAGWWLPKAYTGDHGYNGFYLGMRNGISKDESGNGNDWSLVGLKDSVTYLESSNIINVDYPVVTGDSLGGQNGAGAGWATVFDGTGTGFVQVGPVSGRSSISTCNFDPPIPVGSSCILKWNASRFSNGEIFVNGTNIVTGWVAGSTNLADETEIASTFPGGIRSLSVTNNPGDNSSIIYWLKVDGSYVTFPASFFTETTTLTFEDDTNLDDFRVGNNVGESNGVTYSVAGATGEPILGGDPFKSATFSGGDTIIYWTGDTPTITFTYPEPVDFGTLGINNFRGGAYTGSVTYFMTFVDENGNISQGSASTATSWNITSTPLTPPNKVKSFSITGRTGFAFLGWYNDSTFVPTGEFSTDSVAVTSIDAENNQMVVNGGTWDASDRSRVWSAGVASGDTLSSSGYEKAFDGVGEVGGTFDPNHLVGIANGINTIDLAFPINLNSSDTIEVVGYYSAVTAANSGGVYFRAPAGAWIKVPFNEGATNVLSGATMTGSDIGSSISAIRLVGGAGLDWAGLNKITINGRTLINSDINSDQNWSQYMNLGSAIYLDNNKTPQMMFDGNTDTYATLTGGPEIYFNFRGSGLVANSEISVWLNPDSNEILINGVTATGSGIGWYSRTFNSPTELEDITTSGTDSPSGVAKVAAIRVDGRILVEKDLRQFGADKAIRQKVDGDDLIDVPTSSGADTGLGNEVLGNYCTLDSNNASAPTTKGNSTIVGSSNWNVGHALGTVEIQSGKWYWEATIEGSGTTSNIGVANSSFDLTEDFSVVPANSWTITIANGNVNNPAGTGAGYLPGSYGLGSVIGIALDMDAGTIKFSHDGVFGSAFSLTATSTSSTVTSESVLPLLSVYDTTVSLNFGSKPFNYQAPAGYLCLVDTNLS